MDKPSAPSFAPPVHATPAGTAFGAIPFAPVVSDDPASDPLDARLARALVGGAALCVGVIAILASFA